MTVAVNNVVTLNTDIQNGNVAALNTVMMLGSYKGVKFTLEMKMTYNLILSFTRTGKRAEFSQSYLAAYLSCSLRTAATVIATLKTLGLISADPENRGRGDVDLLEALPILADDAKLSEVKRVNNRKSKGVKNESGPTVGNKAQSVKPSNSPTESTPENTHDARPVGIDDSHSAEPVNTEQPAQPSQLPPVIVEEQPAQPEEPEQPAEAEEELEEEEEEPDFNSYAAMAAPVALSGWVTTHNATVELKAAYEAHRNTYGESHSIPSYAHHTPSYSTAEYDAGEAF
ncbi:helix-turn-helix domain-containing protein [Serratia marcescens]|uniref:hypothetical protein n=1 Tax=Serratia marcescens TaxID=615 RepID=UPI00065214EA|nr:hypothetical protein [Serratia marcescens]KMJ16671.1 hypothetical protein SN04_01258 [Serratia marcescens]